MCPAENYQLFSESNISELYSVGGWLIEMATGEVINPDSFYSRPFSTIFPSPGSSTIRKDYVYNIQWKNFRPKRGGIIPYCTLNGVRYFNLGLYRRSADLTDFGGYIDYNHDEDALKGALREFSEESLSVFGKIPRDVLNGSVAIYDIDMILLFVDVTQLIDGKSMELIEQEFCDRVARKRHKKNREIRALTWVTEDSFRWLVDHEFATLNILGTNLSMYCVVREFLHRAGDFYSML